MVDTLKLAKRLEDAGLERPVAEAMAEAFAESTVETVATKQDLREQVGILRAELGATADRLNARMDGLAGTLRAEIEGSADRLNARMDGLAGTLRAEMQALRWQVIGAVALMLLVHLGAVWGIIAAHVP
jgi:hypothetical protein